MTWCIDCGDDFRYDDCGGYNPPCECGFHCRHCHEAGAREEAEYEDAWSGSDAPSDHSPGIEVFGQRVCRHPELKCAGSCRADYACND